MTDLATQRRTYKQFIRFQQAAAAFATKQQELQALQEQLEHLAKDVVVQEAKFKGALEIMGNTTYRFDVDSKSLFIDDEKISSEGDAVESAATMGGLN